jgi:hypothetical protein
VNYEANFCFFILLHKRVKPILPPYLLPHSARELKPYTPPLPSLSAHLSVHTLHPTHPPIPPPTHLRQDLSKKFHSIKSNYKTNSELRTLKEYQLLRGLRDGTTTLPRRRLRTSGANPIIIGLGLL